MVLPEMLSYLILGLYLGIFLLDTLISCIYRNKLYQPSQTSFQKLLKIIYNIWVNSMLFAYFDVIAVFMNSAVYSKSELFGLLDFLLLVLRGAFIIFPLIHLYSEEKEKDRKEKEKEKENKKKKKRQLEANNTGQLFMLNKSICD